MKSNINIILPLILAILLPGLSLYTSGGVEIPERLGFFGSWLVTSVILYTLWHLLLPLWKIKSNKRTWWFIIGIAVAIGVAIVLLYLFAFRDNGGLSGHVFLRLILASILILAIQYALKAQQNIAQLQLKTQQLQTENYKVQLRAIRNKIDPHFLFNSLNTLRSMVRQQHTNSEQFIMSLSDFYRTTLKYDENTSLRLSEELAVLQSYLFLMKSRNEEAIHVKIDVDESALQFQLPTLALQVAVENCFKHNSMTSKMPLHIEISNTDDYYIMIRNNIQPKLGDVAASGFGLDMLRKRYDLLNIQKGVVVEETPAHFTVKLKLF
jgi:two-component system LytT family sensor kinase